MERLIRVFLADPSEDYVELLRSELEQWPDLCVVGAATRGDVACARLAEQSPDVLVADLLLPGLDGLSMLRRLKTEGRLPRTMVVSGFVNDRIAQALTRLGIEDYLPKPCGVEALVSRIREVADPNRRPAIRAYDPAVREALLRAGIMPHLSGAKYLQEGALLALEDRTLLRGVTKILYPDVARRFHTTPSCVERSIRGAIERAWKTGDPEERRRYFGGMFDCFTGAPTNVRFLTLIVEFIEIEYDKLDVWAK